MDKKIGILVNSEIGLFSNGILQNAYFLLVCLQKAGFVCQLLSLKENPKQFECFDTSVKQLSTDISIFDPSEYSAIIHVNSNLTNELYTYLKSKKIFISALVCGNNLMMDLDDFAHGAYSPGRTSFIGKDCPIDDLWIIPCYYFAVEYVSLMRGKPARIVPHLWSPTLIEETSKPFIKHDESLIYNLSNHVSKKIDILILEPNLNFYKSAWIPIVACEKLHKMYPDLINNVYIFNCPTHDQANHMFKNLEIKDKLKKFARLRTAEIFSFFNKQKTMPILVSHTILNELNYTYYEALNYGWPLVHNSSLLDECGYKYSENSLTDCANAIYTAFENHNKTLEHYKQKGKLFLEKVNPSSTDIQLTFKELVTEGILRSQID